jgi:hypothetical protein
MCSGPSTGLVKTCISTDPCALIETACVKRTRNICTLRSMCTSAVAGEESEQDCMSHVDSIVHGPGSLLWRNNAFCRALEAWEQRRDSSDGGPLVLSAPRNSSSLVRNQELAEAASAVGILPCVCFRMLLIPDVNICVLHRKTMQGRQTRCSMEQRRLAAMEAKRG